MFSLTTEDPYYGTEGPRAARVTLHTEDGDACAMAFRDDASGRYMTIRTPNRDTLLYREWQLCLIDQLDDSFSRAERQAALDAISEGFSV